MHLELLFIRCISTHLEQISHMYVYASRITVGEVYETLHVPYNIEKANIFTSNGDTFKSH